MYEVSVPTFQRMLANLQHILAKAQSHVELKRIDPSALLQARLFPDMFALTRQVQICTDTVKGCVFRLAGEAPPRWDDTETTFPELQARVQKALDLLATIKPEQINDSEARRVEFKIGGYELAFHGQDYLNSYVLPNLYFHLTTVYAILRHNGVELGKVDYLGKVGQ